MVEKQDQFYEQWKDFTYSALQDFQAGLKKCPWHDLQQKVHEAIEAYHHSKTEFINITLKIQYQLNELLTKKTILHADTMLFLLSAQQTFNHLLCIIYTLVLSECSTTLPSNQANLNKLRNYIASEIGKRYLLDLLKNSTHWIILCFKENVKKFPSPINLPELIDKYGIHSMENPLLKLQMGEKRFLNSYTDKPIYHSKNMSSWLTKETKRLTFDHFYTMCVQLYHLHHTAQNHSVLATIGLMALTTKGAKKYLNKIAVCLGFSSLAALYENFIDLVSLEGLEKYNTLKKEFALEEDDPSCSHKHALQDLLLASHQEYTRLLPLLLQENFVKNNFFYIPLIMENKLNFSSGIVSSLEIAELLHKINKKDHIKSNVYPLESLQHYLSLHNNASDDSLKKNLKSNVLFCITEYSHFQETLLRNIHDKLNEQQILNKENTLQEKKENHEERECKKMEERVHTIFQDSSLTDIDDPFFYVFKKIFPDTLPLTTTIKKTIYVETQKQYTLLLEKLAHSLERRVLEKTAIALQKGYLLASSEEQIYYSTLIKIVEHSLQKIYKHYLQGENFSEKTLFFEELNADFITYYQNFIESRKKTNSLHKAYHAWIINPFALFYNQNILNRFEADEISQKIIFSQFCLRYTIMLKFYASHIPKNVLPLNKTSIYSHFQRLENEYHFAQRLAEENSDHTDKELASVFNAQNFVLQETQHSIKSHPENKLIDINHDYHRLQRKMTKLSWLITSIEQSLITDITFNLPVFLKFEKIFSSLTNNIVDLRHQIQSFDGLRFSDRAMAHWTHRKYELLYYLDECEKFYHQIEKEEYAAFKFYHQIISNESLDLPSLKTKHYGTGLLLAIYQDCYALSLRILEVAGSKINIQFLARALHFALEKNQTELLKKIYSARKDISFNNADLLILLKKALKRKKINMVRDLLFHTSLELDFDSTELLQDSEFVKSTTLIPVKKSFLQLLIDSDGVILENMRQCYAVQQALLLSLKDEFDYLVSQIDLDEHSVNYFLNKVDKTYPLQKMMLDFYKNHAFSNPGRRYRYVYRWNAQIDAIRNNYVRSLNGFSYSPRPSLSIEKEQTKEFIMNAIDDEAHSHALLAYLAKLNTLVREKDTEYYHRTLSEALYHAVNKNKIFALDILLSCIEEPDRKAEYAFNALCQALVTCQVECVKFLLTNKAYLHYESEILYQLTNIYNQFLEEPYSSEQAKIKSILIQSLSFIPFELDTHILNFIDCVAFHPNTHIAKVHNTFIQKWSFQEDISLLEHLRKIYLFCEQGYQKACDAFWEIRYPFELLLNQGDFSKNHIEFYEHKIEIFEEALHQQIRVLKKLKANYVKHFMGTTREIKNPSKLQYHLSMWDSNLANVLSMHKKTAEQDLHFVKTCLRSKKLGKSIGDSSPAKKQI